MNTRAKLNSAAVRGSLVVAALAGAVAESWTVFGLAAAVLIAMSFNSGDIRVTGRRS